jgi:hypothetical protein
MSAPSGVDLKVIVPSFEFDDADVGAVSVGEECWTAFALRDPSIPTQKLVAILSFVF